MELQLWFNINLYGRILHMKMSQHWSNSIVQRNIIKEIGVLRNAARVPQPPTDQPTGHQMNQEYMFWAKFGRFWAKNPNWYLREEQNFWYPHNE